MNIKTTIILLVLLAGVGAAVWFTRDKDTGETKPVVHTLVDVKSGDITRFVITSSDGKTLAAEKSSDMPAVWKITQPVTATADSMKIESLLDTLTALQSTAELNISGSDAPKTGLDKPQFTVDLFVGKQETKLTIGDRLPVGDTVYVQVQGNPAVETVSNSVLDSLDKSATDFRKMQLFDAASPSVQQLTVTQKDGSQTVLEKLPRGWTMIKPTTMPVDESAASEMASAIVNMTPVQFLQDPSAAAGLNKPQASVTFSTVPPATQPANVIVTPMPGGVTVLFGGYDNLEKKNVFAQLPDGSVVKVAAATLDSLNKKPFELRDKTVMDQDPIFLSKAVIEMNQPATTQPTTMPAVNTSTVLIHAHKPATTQVIGPVLGGPEWQVGGAKIVDADGVKVTAALSHFHPLKAEVYLEKPSTDKMVKTYKITLFPGDGKAADAEEITLSDPGNDQNLIGSYNGLTFTTSRTVLTDLAVDFVKPPAPPAPATQAATTAPSALK